MGTGSPRLREIPGRSRRVSGSARRRATCTTPRDWRRSSLDMRRSSAPSVLAGRTPRIYDDQVRGTAAIIAAIKQAGIRRVLWVGGAGGLEVTPGVRVVDDPSLPDWIRPGSLATINALEQLRAEPTLDWSFLAPSAEMQPGQRTGHFRLGEDQLLVDANGKSHISVEDFAVAMINELDHPAHLRQRFTVGY